MIIIRMFNIDAQPEEKSENSPRIPLLEITPQALERIRQKNIKHLVIGVIYFEEPCLQIYDPVVKTFFDAEWEKKDNYIPLKIQGKNYNEGKKGKMGISAWVSSDFSNKFLSFRPGSDRTKDKPVIVHVKGLLRKKFVVQNVEPIIVNVCKK